MRQGDQLFNRGVAFSGVLCFCSRVSACTLCARLGAVLLPALPRKGKGYFLNFETGAGVKYKSSSAPACVISGRLIYLSSPSGQRSDFTNPKTCSCSSMSFSMMYQSQPLKKIVATAARVFEYRCKRVSADPQMIILDSIVPTPCLSPCGPF